MMMQIKMIKKYVFKATFMFTSCGFLLACVGSAFAVPDEGGTEQLIRFVEDGFKDSAKAVRENAEKNEKKIEALENEIEELEKQLETTPEGGVRDAIKLKYERKNREVERLKKTGGLSAGERGLQGLALKAGDTFFNTMALRAKTQFDAEADVKRQAMKNQGTLDVVNNVMKWIIGNPGPLAGLVALSAAGISATYFGGKLLYRYGEKVMGMPKILSWTNVPTGWQRLFGIKQKEESRLKEFVAPPGIEAQIKRIAKTIKNKIKHKRLLSNVLFYGPPGTGKTFFAKELSREAGAYCDIIAGANFSQFVEGEDITQLNKWFDSREMVTKNDNKPIIVFIDEADALLVDRRLTQEDRIKRLVNTFLSRVEKPSSHNIMFIFATNHPDMLDPAVESRIGSKIEFKLPELEQRKKLITVYANKHIKGYNIKLSPDVENFMVNSYAPKLEGFSARDIEQIMVDVQTAVDEVGTSIVTQSMVSDVIEKKIIEHALFAQLEQEKRKKHNVSGLVGSQGGLQQQNLVVPLGG